MDKKIVKTTVDGNDVVGEIVIETASDISVKLTKPYGEHELHTGSHIPAFALPFKKFTPENTENICECLLDELFRITKFAKKNQKKLREKFKIKQVEIDNLTKEGLLTEIQFKEQKMELRKSLKQGNLTPIEYQRALSPIRKKHEQYEVKSYLIISEFFEENFPMIVSYSLKKKILKVILED